MHVEITADAMALESPDTLALDCAACGMELVAGNPPFLRHLSSEQVTAGIRFYYFGLKVRVEMNEMGMA